MPARAQMLLADPVVAAKGEGQPEITDVRSLHKTCITCSFLGRPIRSRRTRCSLHCRTTLCATKPSSECYPAASLCIANVKPQGCRPRRSASLFDGVNSFHLTVRLSQVAYLLLQRSFKCSGAWSRTGNLSQLRAATLVVLNCLCTPFPSCLPALIKAIA